MIPTCQQHSFSLNDRNLTITLLGGEFPTYQSTLWGKSSLVRVFKRLDTASIPISTCHFLPAAKQGKQVLAAYLHRIYSSSKPLLKTLAWLGNKKTDFTKQPSFLPVVVIISDIHCIYQTCISKMDAFWGWSRLRLKLFFEYIYIHPAECAPRWNQKFFLLYKRHLISVVRAAKVVHPLQHSTRYSSGRIQPIKD